jgi:hypothetical protein
MAISPETLARIKNGGEGQGKRPVEIRTKKKGRPGKGRP